jgi:hypothetical protein
VDTILETYKSWHWLLIEGRIILLVAFVTGEFVALKLYKMGAEDQQAKITGGKVRTYPALYFAILSAQITPLLITGMVERDYLIVLTRASMLLAAMWSWAIVRTKTGYFPWRLARLWLYPLAFLLSTFVWAWVEYPSVSLYFKDHQQFISLIFGWVSVAMMAVLVIVGQFATARSIWEGLRSGHYAQPGFQLQWLRVGNFGSQALHYAEVSGLHSQIFLASAIGLFGSMGLLLLHLLGRLGLWRLIASVCPGFHKTAEA